MLYFFNFNFMTKFEDINKSSNVMSQDELLQTLGGAIEISRLSAEAGKLSNANLQNPLGCIFSCESCDNGCKTSNK